MNTLAEKIAGLSAEQRARLATELRRRRDDGRISRRSDRTSPVPLSSAQYGLWLTDQSNAEASVFNVSVLINIEGELNASAVRKAVNQLLQRHEALRTRIEVVDGAPMQIVEPEVQIEIPVIRLARESTQHAEDIVLPLAQQQDREPFYLARAPLLRISLAIVSDGAATTTSVLVVTLHHIVSDAWSKNILVKELLRLYDAVCLNEPHSLTPEPGQYPDYALWEQSYLINGRVHDDLAYWQKRLADTPPPFSLPADLPPTPVKSGSGAATVFTLNETITENLKTFCRQHGITLFMGLLGALAALLKHYGCADDLIVGADSANRQNIDTEDMVGFFINQIALRINLTGNPAFADLIRKIRELVIEDYKHQQAPFGKVVEIVKPKRYPSRSPFFETKLVLENTPKSPSATPGLKASCSEVKSSKAEYDTIWLFTESDKALEVRIQYDADKYTSALMSHYTGQYQKILMCAIKDPSQTLSELSNIIREHDKSREKMLTEQRRENKLRTLRSTRRNTVFVE